MPRIADSRGRANGRSGYSRLLGNAPLGQLFSRVHATVIRTGNDLEAILRDATPYRTPVAVLARDSPLWGQSPRQVIDNASFADLRGHTADFVVLCHPERRAYVVEVKDGDTFDTKKASGELENLQVVTEYVHRRTAYDTTYHFCSFNQTSRAAIVLGAKQRFAEHQAMTGREFCDLIGVDYDRIVLERTALQAENLDYLLKQLIAIPEVREWLRRHQI